MFIHMGAGKSSFSGAIPIRIIQLVEASVPELSCCSQGIGRLYWRASECQKTTNEGSGRTFFQVSNFFFYIRGGKTWSSAHTLGPILIRNEPKCSKLNCRQFEYIFIKIYSTLSRNFFKKTGAGGGNPRRPPPLNPQKILNSQSCWPTNSLQEYPRIVILAIIMPEI